ncbi:MAG TPA: ribonuclease HI family protein [Actinomycetota bacterium]|nr:ribonuclease HI family protein [Actinomycetota bacterium]
MSVPKRGGSNGEWQLRTDGAARGNPGPAGIGVVLVGPDGAVVDELAKGIGWATNNVAEYQALIEGLRLARSHGVDRLAVFSDSTLLVEQMKGRWKVKHPGLKPLFSLAGKLAREVGNVRYAAVPRERNRRADELANLGIDRDNPQAEAPLPGAESERLF